MASFFPDLNVWLAVSVDGHVHHKNCWNWLSQLNTDVRLIFSRYTQVGLLRLLTNAATMGDETLTLGKAWTVYDRWLADPRVHFYPEPRNFDAAFRGSTVMF